MKILPRHRQHGITDSRAGFDALVGSFRVSIKSWDYFVNWDKVYDNANSVRRDLHLWNSLLGTQSFDEEFLELLEEYPNVIRVMPQLLVRDGANSTKFDVVLDLAAEILEQESFDFASPASTAEARNKALRFAKRTGIKRLFTHSGVVNLVDYIIGVEAGLDSNGRKNRSGKAMEFAVERQINRISELSELEWMSQATPKKIAAQWGFNVNVDKSSRSFDFAITDNKKLLLVEVNFYGAGGSKLKSVAGEFSQLTRIVSDENVAFAWVTDGKGWQTALFPLEEAYEKIDLVLNLSMLPQGYIQSFFDRG